MHTSFGRGFTLTLLMLAVAAVARPDTLILTDGQQVRGYYEGGTARKIRFRTDAGTWEYDVFAVARIRIDSQTAAVHEEPRVVSRPEFLPDEVRSIRNWFQTRSNLRNLPPGLAKRESLPPGLARQVRKNGTLPPGLQKRVEPLPWDLERRLPQRDAAMRRVVIGGSVVLLNETTSVILDIIADVF